MSYNSDETLVSKSGLSKFKRLSKDNSSWPRSTKRAELSPKSTSLLKQVWYNSHPHWLCDCIEGSDFHLLPVSVTALRGQRWCSTWSISSALDEKLLVVFFFSFFPLKCPIDMRFWASVLAREGILGDSCFTSVPYRAFTKFLCVVRPHWTRNLTRMRLK